jgi:hypothetical protein
MVSDEHTVVISYDGETDCDDDDAARWSRDGQDQGLVTGVSCAVTGNRAGLVQTVFLLALSIGAAARRRQRAQQVR